MKKNTQNRILFENNSKFLSKYISFNLKSSENKSFYGNIEESQLKLIKMEHNIENDDLTLPNISCKGIIVLNI